MPNLHTYAGRSVKNKNRNKKTTTNNKQQSWAGMPNLRTHQIDSSATDSQILNTQNICIVICSNIFYDKGVK